MMTGEQQKAATSEGAEADDHQTLAPPAPAPNAKLAHVLAQMAARGVVLDDDAVRDFAVRAVHRARQRRLFDAARLGRADDVAALLADGADVNKPMTDGATLLHIATNQGVTPLLVACHHGHPEVVANLLAANATVDLVINDHPPALVAACFHGHLGIVQLLSSYGASRTFPFAAPGDTAEHLATHRGHRDLVAWLIRSRHWTRCLLYTSPSPRDS